MPRYIDADALENEVHTFCREFIVSCRDFRTKCALYDAMKGVLVRIYDAPTISPDEARGVGEWEHQELAPTNWTFCSVCGRQRSKKYKWYYCPNCGARMKGAEENHTMDEFMYGQEIGGHSDGSL